MICELCLVLTWWDQKFERQRFPLSSGSEHLLCSGLQGGVWCCLEHYRYVSFYSGRFTKVWQLPTHTHTTMLYTDCKNHMQSKRKFNQVYNAVLKKTKQNKTKQKNKPDPGLAGVAQWIECWPVNQRAGSLIPSQGTCLGCRPGPQLGVRKRQPHTDVSLPLLLPPFPHL